MTSPATKQLSKGDGQVPAATGDTVDVTYPVKLTSNILDELRRRKIATKVPVATQIRHMVETQMAIVDPVNAALDTHAIAQEVAKQTIEALLPKIGGISPQKGALCVELSQSDKSLFEKTAANLGYESTYMLEELAKWAMSEPAVADALVFSKSRPRVPANRQFSGGSSAEVVLERLEENTGTAPSPELMNFVSDHIKARKNRNTEE